MRFSGWNFKFVLFASRKQTTQYVSICFSHISSLGMVVWSFDMLWETFRGISLSHVGNSKSPWLVPQAMLSYLSKPNAELKPGTWVPDNGHSKTGTSGTRSNKQTQRGRKGWQRTEKEMAINKTKRPGSICSTTQRNLPSIDLVRNWLTKVTLEWMFQAVGLCTAVFVVVPHIFVWGSCFWFCIPPPPPLLRLLLRLLRPLLRSHTHTIFHTQLLLHTIFHTQLLLHTIFHTPILSHTIFHTIFHTPTLSHTIFHTPTLSPTIFHTPTLSHTHYLSHQHIQLSLTYNFVSHHLCHTPTLSQSLSHNYLSHTTLLPTIFHTQLCRTPPPLSHTICFAWQASLCAAGVALGDIHLRFAWQVWHLVTFTFVSCGRRGTYGTGLRFAWQAWPLWHWAGSSGALGRAGAHLVTGDAAQLCVAGMALGDIHFRFAWQVCHLATSTCVLRGRRGTWSLPLWHLATCTFVSRGRCGTWSHSPSFCVAGLALMTSCWLLVATHHLSHSIFVTHNFHTPPLSRTIFHTPSVSHTIFQTKLCHTPSFTQNFVTHHLSRYSYHVVLLWSLWPKQKFPAVISPLKPKYYWLSVTGVSAKHAVLLK